VSGSRASYAGAESQRPSVSPTSRFHHSVVGLVGVSVPRLVLAVLLPLFLSLHAFCWWEKPRG
jgi:hypothetical protein